MQAASTGSGRIALRTGIFFGVILGIIEIVLTAIGAFANLGSAAWAVTIISWIIGIGAYLWAGIRASSQTGNVSTGLLAGLWTGLFSSIISAIGSTIFFFINRDATRRAIQAGLNQAQRQGQNAPFTADQLLTYGLIIGIVLSILAAVVIGLAIGALGGAIGKGRAPVPVQTYQETMFQAPPPNPYQ
ncbi:MAG: DUF4199 domain-containing protein [Chloroflexota bacterium]|nr:DUF4199 domain-containing protein [Chloroflexota bacterium]